MVKDQEPKHAAAFTCVYCENPFQDAVVLTCGHSMCSDCVVILRQDIAPAVRGDGRIVGPIFCPMCGERIVGLVPNETVRRFMSECVRIQCCCEQWVDGSEFQKHTSACSQAVFLCNGRHATDDSVRCNQTMNYNVQTRQQHRQVCSLRPMQCSYCNEHLNHNDFEEHLQSVCPEWTVQCSQCEEKVSRSLMESHLDQDCPKTLVLCKMCDARVERRMIRKHESTPTAVHFRWCLDSLEQVKLDLARPTSTHHSGHGYGNGRSRARSNSAATTISPTSSDGDRTNYSSSEADSPQTVVATASSRSRSLQHINSEEFMDHIMPMITTDEAATNIAATTINLDLPESLMYILMDVASSSRQQQNAPGTGSNSEARTWLHELIQTVFNNAAP